MNGAVTIEKGISKEKLMHDIDFLKRDIRKFIMHKIYLQDNHKQSRINDEYGNYNAFAEEVVQELYIWCIERLDRIPCELSYKYIFFSLRHILKRMLYKSNPCMRDIEIKTDKGDSIGTIINSIPDETIHHVDMENSDEYYKLIDDIKNAGLNETEKQIISLKFWSEDDVTMVEIANKTGLKLGNAYTYYSKAIDKIRIHLVQNHPVDKILNMKKSFAIKTVWKHAELEFLKQNWHETTKPELLKTLNKGRDKKLTKNDLYRAAVSVGVIDSVQNFKEISTSVELKYTYQEKRYIQKNYLAGKSAVTILEALNLKRDRKILIEELESYIDENLANRGIRRSDKFELTEGEINFIREQLSKGIYKKDIHPIINEKLERKMSWGTFKRVCKRLNIN